MNCGGTSYSINNISLWTILIYSLGIKGKSNVKKFHISTSIIEVEKMAWTTKNFL